MTMTMLDGLLLRPFSDAQEIAPLTALLHRASARLAAMDLRFMATHQPPEVTARRVAEGECLLAYDGDRLVGSILYRPAARTGGSPWLDRAEVASLAQLAVEPGLQSRGLGARLMRWAEARAAAEGAAEIALDTAEPATHLVAWYARSGYRAVETAQWSHTNYRSVIMSRAVASFRPGAIPA